MIDADYISKRLANKGYDLVIGGVNDKGMFGKIINNYLGSRRDLKGSRIYVDLFPCNECAKDIVQAGIKEVIYLSDKYNGTDGNIVSKKIFDTCGVKYRRLDKSEEKIIKLFIKPDVSLEYLEK